MPQPTGKVGRVLHAMAYPVCQSRRKAPAGKLLEAFTICCQQNSIIAKIEPGNQLHANYAHGGDSILSGMRIASMG